MPDDPLSVALLGGIPPSLGGGGLELQRDRTAAALRARGHEVFQVALESAPRPFDVLHAFGSEVDVWQHLQHWRRNPAPLVVSPVIVAAPGAEERLLRASARVPLRSLAPRMRADVLRRADLLVALTEHEAGLLRDLAPGVTVETIDNGVDRGGASIPPDAAALGLQASYALLLGTVSERKRQRDTVAALGRTGLQPVVVGGFDGTDADRAAFEHTVSMAGGRWLGEVRDPAAVRGLVHGAAALVHLSAAEGQSLAVLEALAEGTPVICSPLPANLELARRFPAHVRVCAGVAELAAAVAALPTERGAPPAVPTWDDVAAALERGYRALVSARS